MSALADRIEAVSRGHISDSAALSEAVRIGWLTARDKDVIRRIMYGNEHDQDWFRLLEISNRLREQEE